MVVMEMVCTQSDSLSEEKSAVNRKVENEVREKAETAPGTIPYFCTGVAQNSQRKGDATTVGKGDKRPHESQNSQRQNVTEKSAVTRKVANEVREKAATAPGTIPYFCTGVSQNSQRKGDAPIVGKGDKRPHERHNSQRQKVTRKVANEVREKAATAPGTIPYFGTGEAENSQRKGDVQTLAKGDKRPHESQNSQRQNDTEKSNDMRNEMDEARGKGAMPTKSTPPSASGEDISKTKTILQRLGPYISLAKLGLMLFRRNPYAYCVVEVLDVLEILSVKQSGLDCIVGGAAAVIDKMMNSSSANTRALGAILHVILTIMTKEAGKEWLYALAKFAEHCENLCPQGMTYLAKFMSFCNKLEDGKEMISRIISNVSTVLDTILQTKGLGGVVDILGKIMDALEGTKSVAETFKSYINDIPWIKSVASSVGSGIQAATQWIRSWFGW